MGWGLSLESLSAVTLPSKKRCVCMYGRMYVWLCVCICMRRVCMSAMRVTQTAMRACVEFALL